MYLVIIGPDTRQDDVILLSPLKGVYAGNLNLVVQLLAHGSIAQHDLQDVGTLALIGGDDPQLLWGSTPLQEVGHNLFNIGSLCSTGGSSDSEKVGVDTAVSSKLRNGAVASGDVQIVLGCPSDGKHKDKQSP